MATEQYLDAITTEYYNGSAWVDISAWVVGDITGNNGLGGWKPDQRVAALGTLNITLNNKSKYFSPMGGDTLRGLSTLTGFNKGAKIRVRGLYYPFIAKDIWTGRIISIDSDDKNWGNEQTRIMAVDWMNVPVNFPMKGATIALNQRIDQAMTLILARLSIQPDATEFATGSFTFPAVFDNVQRKTMALSEFTKLANSELGYIYVKQDGTLVSENMLSRQGWRALDQVWIVSATDSYILAEDNTFILAEDGTKIIGDEGAYEDAAIHADMEEHNILLPEDALLNASIIRAHPVITDTSLKVLYKLGTPVFIPGRTYEFSAHYTDPSGLSQVSGTNMQAPVATTDYLANTASDGSGTNKTSDIVVTATYYGDTVYYSITNNGSVGVYITFLQARGYGIYYGNSIESTKEDDVSQDLYGYSPFQFDMKYQKDTYLADMYGLSVIEEYKTPKSRITKMKFLANLNKNHLITFLTLTIGSLILGTEDRSAISNHYYITDRAFTIKQGGIINVEYGVKQNESYLSGGVNPVTVEFGGYDEKEALNYGNLPIVANSNLYRTFSAWVYAFDPVSETGDYTIFSNYPGGGGGGWQVIFLRNTLNLQLWVLGDNDTGVWITPGNLTRNAWNHVVISRDSSNKANQPIMYINGVSQTVTETNSQDTDTADEIGSNFILGNRKNGSEDYTFPFKGQIFDARIYNRILTAAEVTTLYNGGTPDHTLVTDGLVFQGPAVYADQGTAASLAGTVLSSSDRVIENIVRAVGIPNGSPTIRANP